MMVVAGIGEEGARVSYFSSPDSCPFRTSRQFVLYLLQNIMQYYKKIPISSGFGLILVQGIFGGFASIPGDFFSFLNSCPQPWGHTPAVLQHND